MQDNKKINSQINSFDEAIRNKIYDHCTPIDTASWDQIRLATKRKPTKMIWWFSSSVAAILISVLMTVYVQKNNNTNNKAITLLNNGDELSKNFKIKRENFSFLQLPDPIANNKSEKGTRTVNNAAQNQKESTIRETNINSLEYEKETFNNVSSGDNSPILVSEVQGTKDSSTISDDNKEEIITIPNLDDNDIFLASENNSNNKQGKWTLASSIGVSNSSSTAGKQNYLSDYTRIPDKQSIVQLASPNPYEYGNISYNTPISVGITIRKNINKRIGIESGIVYTNLSTKFEGVDNSLDEAKLSLHYLGAPLNVVAYLWNDSKWNVYLSAGGMVEKGIKSIYKRDTRKNNVVTTSTAKQNIDGIQWSLNASSGISYRLISNWGVYLEPKISYYFDNDQPISIRTKKSAVFNINAGVRYEF